MPVRQRKYTIPDQLQVLRKHVSDKMSLLGYIKEQMCMFFYDCAESFVYQALCNKQC